MRKQLAPGSVGADTVTLIVCALTGALAFSVAACERNASSGSPAAAASPVESAAVAANPPRRELAAVAGAPPAPRWSPTPPPAPADADRGLCRAVCARAAVLHCPGGANCEAHCEDMRAAVPTCGREMLAALRCFATLPASGWECADDGLPSAKEGQCEREQAGVAACVGR